jgi:hypothetical protein
MKTWHIAYEQNGEEYVGYIKILAKRLKKIDKTKILADGVTIELDEKIISIEEEEPIQRGVQK